MIVFIARRIIAMMVSLGLLMLVGFSLSYYPPDAPLQGVELWDAWCFWFNSLRHFQFGDSSINGLSISLQLKEVLPATIELCASAFLLALLIGIPWGVLSAFNRQKWFDKLTGAFTLLGFSIPVFWLGLLLTLLLSLTLGWLPVSGRLNLLYPLKSVTGFTLIDIWLSDSPWREQMAVNALHHLLLPMLTLALAPLTEVIKLMRSMTLEIINQSYIKAAIIRGLSRVTVVRRHVLHNALPPMIPHLGLQFSTMLTLAMITEAMFNWPGIGLWLIGAIRHQDYASLSAGFMVVGTLVIAVNLLSDILGVVMDPMKRKEGYALR